MRSHRRVDSSCFDEDQIKILFDAFEEALFLAQITDRTGPQAEAIAQRVIEVYRGGERNPKHICRQAAAN